MERAREQSDKRADEAEAPEAEEHETGRGDEGETRSRKRKGRGGSARYHVRRDRGRTRPRFGLLPTRAKREADQGVEDQDKRFREKGKELDEVRQVPDFAE